MLFTFITKVNMAGNFVATAQNHVRQLLTLQKYTNVAGSEAIKNSLMNTLWRISVLSGTAITAYFAGKYQAYVDNVKQDLWDGPGVPVFPTVYATTSLIETPGSHFKGPLIPDPENKPVSTAHQPKESTPVATRVSQIMKYGFPSMDNIRSYNDFVLSYNRRNRVADWVFEHLTKERVTYNDKVDRSKCEFFEDQSIHPYFRSKNSDYKGSGFDRGHLAAAGNHKWNQKDCEQTFVLSNMAPQVGHGFNRDSWNRLEKYVRKLTKKYPNVYVCTGPLYLPRTEPDGKMYVKYQVIGGNTVAVPTHFFKVVVMETPNSDFEMEAYVMPNAVISDDTPLTNFQVPLESIERSAGLLFFDRLPKEKLKKINGKGVGKWF